LLILFCFLLFCFAFSFFFFSLSASTVSVPTVSAPTVSAPFFSDDVKIVMDDDPLMPVKHLTVNDANDAISSPADIDIEINSTPDAAAISDSVLMLLLDSYSC
jgi:hypothetical protein